MKRANGVTAKRHAQKGISPNKIYIAHPLQMHEKHKFAAGIF